MALKFLKTPYLEKRVKGITEIRDLTEKLDAVYYQGKPAMKIVTKDFMLKWLREN